MLPCIWSAVLVVASCVRGLIESRSKTYVVTPPYCRILDAAYLCTVAWTWANDGRSRDGHDDRDLGRYSVTVGHGEGAAEFDGDGVFGDATLLARFHGPHSLVVWIELHDFGVLQTFLDILNSSIDEYRLAEWRSEAPLHLIESVPGDRRHDTGVALGLKIRSRERQSGRQE